MPKVIGVRFRGNGKSYHFDPGDMILHQSDAVIVETVHGVEIGFVVDEVIEIPEDKLVAPLKEVTRKATADDMAKYEANKAKERDAFKVCQEKIVSRELEMNLVDVEYTFDGKKIIFYFTADGRVDFRELVKDLASVFRMRIELRQIGVRDEARMIGGVGICGRELCCCSFLGEFMPVSIKMAKSQNLSMNPAKISGCCGRLMCCLKYEQEAYVDARSRMPRQGNTVQTPQGSGTVIGVSLLKETVSVRLDEAETTDLVIFANDEIEITGGRPDRKNPPQGESKQDPGGKPRRSGKRRRSAPKQGNRDDFQKKTKGE